MYFEDVNGWQKRPTYLGIINNGIWSNIDPSDVANSDTMIDLVMRQGETFEYNGKTIAGNYEFKKYKEDIL